ncbi:hypothetical protein E2C01_029168 [Portunus trituberculatus]|uniref:Uncharacterized protein n=1 Tax=Portunus trituberculatus TaxID=210409 RepID=A0A5B7ETY0_PORTR|nr:hypothetical protein [Portunus trituberculatus]
MIPSVKIPNGRIENEVHMYRESNPPYTKYITNLFHCRNQGVKLSFLSELRQRIRLKKQECAVLGEGEQGNGDEREKGGGGDSFWEEEEEEEEEEDDDDEEE